MCLFPNSSTSLAIMFQHQTYCLFIWSYTCCCIFNLCGNSGINLSKTLSALALYSDTASRNGKAHFSFDNTAKLIIDFCFSVFRRDVHAVLAIESIV